MNPYLWAVLVMVIIAAQVTFVALFMGRDRMIDELKRVWAEGEQ